MSRRGSLLALVVAGAVLGGPPAALADEEIVAATPNRYTNPDVTIDQGEPLTLRNTDFAMHDVASTQPGDVKGRLFASDVIGGGETSFVEGSQYLTTGTYDFFCTVHPNSMTGTITVTAAGTPKPRPGAGPAPGPGPAPAPEPDTEAPEPTIRVAAARARTLRRGGALRVTVGSNEASKLRVTVTLPRGVPAGGARAELDTAGTRRLDVKVKRRLRRKLRPGTRLVVGVEARDAAGNVAGAIRRLKLR